MARNKVSPATAAAKKNESHPPPPSGRDLSPDKMECLKTLNGLLVKETVERRQQVEHLRSLLADLADDHTFLAGVEHDVNRLVLSSGLAERELTARQEFDRQVEANLRCLQATVDSMAEELRSGGERLEMVVREKDKLKKSLDRALLEKDSSLVDLDRKEKGRRDLEAKVWELETRITEIGENHGKLEMERNDLVEQGKKREEAIYSLFEEKASMEASLNEYQQSVESIGRRMEEVIKIKQEELESVKTSREAIAAKVTALEGECHNLIENNIRLEAEVNGSKDAIYLMKKGEEGLQNEIAEMEERNAKATEELRSEVAKKEALVAKVLTLERELQNLSGNNQRLEVEANSSKCTVELMKKEEKELRSKVAEMEKRNEKVTEELKRLQTELGALEKEKEEMQIDYKEQMMVSAKELDNLRTRMGETEREKDAIEGVRAVQESEIGNLQKELRHLQSTVHELQVLCKDHTNTNTQLQAERDSACRDLDLQKVANGCLRVQIEEFKKRNNEVEEEMQQLQQALSDFALKEEERKVQSDALKEEKGSVEKKLIATQQSLEDMERKIKAANTNSQRALYLLKSTTKMMHGLVEVKEKAIEMDIGSEEEKDEDLQPFVKELETIKVAFKSRVGKIEDMNRELEVLQHAMAEAQKKAELRKWLYRATTTVFAAISFAYVAKSR